MKKVNFQFLTTIILSVVFFVGGIAVLAYFYSETDGGNLVVTLSFIFLLVSIIISSVISKRLNLLMNLSYQLKIRENASDPVPLRIMKVEGSFKSYLAKNGFKNLKQAKSHNSYYRVVDDNIKKMLAQKMLEVIVYIKDNQTEFYLDAVDDEINNLKDKLLKDKVRINRLFVTQMRNISELNDETKDKIKEIVFMRTRYNIISTVNIGLFQNDIGVMLYSDTYSPSLYYRYHIDQIKKML